MADKKGSIIIKKVKKGGHGGHHGGAWKVAYADFVTAMMAFFMVMWLMGSDEETKASIAAYFNNPTSSWRLDTSDKAQPLGDKTASGESVLNGLDGQNPEELVKTPSRPVNPVTGEPAPSENLVDQSVQGRESDFPMQIANMQFVLDETLIFEPDSDRLRVTAPKHLEGIGKMLKSHPGFVKIVVNADNRNLTYELQSSRVVVLSKYFVKRRHIEEERISSKVLTVSGGEAAQPVIEVNFSSKNASKH